MSQELLEETRLKTAQFIQITWRCLNNGMLTVEKLTATRDVIEEVRTMHFARLNEFGANDEDVSHVEYLEDLQRFCTGALAGLRDEPEQPTGWN